MSNPDNPTISEPPQSEPSQQNEILQQQQQQPQLFYNQQTGQWYDAEGRIYTYEAQNQEILEEGEQGQQGQQGQQGEVAHGQGQHQEEDRDREEVEAFGLWGYEEGGVQRSEDSEHMRGGDREPQSFQLGENLYFDRIKSASKVQEEPHHDQQEQHREVQSINMTKQMKTEPLANPTENDGNEDNYYRSNKEESDKSNKKIEQNFENNYDVKEWGEKEQIVQEKQEVIEVEKSKAPTEGDREPHSFVLGDKLYFDRIKSQDQIQAEQQRKRLQEQIIKKQQQTRRQKQKQQKLLQQIQLLKQREKQRQAQLERERQRQKQRQQERQRERQRERVREQQRDKEREIERERQKERLREIEKLKVIQREQEERKKQEKEQEKEQKRQQEVVYATKTGQEKEQKQEQKVQHKKQKKQKKQKKSKKSKQLKQSTQLKQIKQPQKRSASQVLSNRSEAGSNDPPKPSSQSVLVTSSSIHSPETQVQIQPIFIIKQAQKQRIGTTLKMFSEYTSKHRLHTINQKNVYLSIAEEIDRKKGSKYVWYHFIKEYMMQYQGLTRSFHQNSYKIKKEQVIQNKNAYLNIAEQLKPGTDQLIFLRKETGNSYNRFNEYIGNKINLQLQVAFNKFINDLNKAQSQLSQKKKTCISLQQQFLKFTQKLAKVYNKGRQGKQQDEDVFIETCKYVQLERQYLQSLMQWGKGVAELRKIFITVDGRLSEEVQGVLNLFKTAVGNIYGFHPQKFQTMLSSKQEIARETKYSKLAALADSDYIKYTLQVIKSPTQDITEKDFNLFVLMPHFQLLTGRSTDLLKGMINKSFQLKDNNQELINTISGNLVHFNRETSEYREKFIVKNLVANIVAEGVIQFDEILPGIIFSNSRTVRMSFRDQDRAEELICLLNEKI